MAITSASNIVKEFNQFDFQQIILNNVQPQLRYRTHFPLRYNPGLNFGNIERDSDANIMASVVAFGAKAPRVGRTFASSVKSQIPKIEQARDLDEVGMFRYRDLSEAINRQIDVIRRNPQRNPDGTVSENSTNQMNSLGATLVAEIYNDPIFCQNTVNNRLEWMAKQIASTGKIELSTITNAKGVKGMTLDFGIPEADPTVDWDDADADPILDLQNLKRTALTKGFNQMVMITDSITADRMIALESVSNFVFGLPINPGSGFRAMRPTMAQLNGALQAQGLPTLQIWDSFLVEQNKAGENVGMSGWMEGRILLSDSVVLGDTVYTQSEAFNSNIDGSVTSKQVVDNMILVQQWGQVDPDMLSSKALAYAIPIINNTKRKTILKAFTA